MRIQDNAATRTLDISRIELPARGNGYAESLKHDVVAADVAGDACGREAAACIDQQNGVERIIVGVYPVGDADREE